MSLCGLIGGSNSIVQLNGNNVKINLSCHYDTTLSNYKTIISIACHSMRYVWYDMPQHSTIKHLLNKIRKIYNINIESIQEFDLSTQIPEIQKILNTTLNITQNINTLVVNLNDNNNNNDNYYRQFNNSNENHFKIESLINNNADYSLLKKRLSIFLENIYCPLQCVLKYNNNNHKIYNDIPNKEQIIEFLNTINAYASNEIFMDILLPSIVIKIHHQCKIYFFYAFTNMLFLYSNENKSEIASKIINNKYNISYNDILNLLDVDGYTFMDVNNEYFELDLYEEININIKRKTQNTNLLSLQCLQCLHTKQITENTFNRCVICQENVSPSQFTRINCCDHIYHYQCIKQYLQHLNNNIFKPLCPLCRKSFTLLQVHNNLLLQTLQINNSEFINNNNIKIINHELQDSDITDTSVALFSDIEENDGDLVAVSHNNYHDDNNNNFLSPSFDELDEFYRIGLSLINDNTQNSSITITEVNDENEPNDNNNNNNSLLPNEPNEEPNNINDRNSLSISFSSYSDKIGRLSLSNVSTSATVGGSGTGAGASTGASGRESQNHPTRPSLRYIYSPIPFYDDNSPTPTTKVQINPYNIMETKTISIPFSEYSSASTSINLFGNDDVNDIPAIPQTNKIRSIQTFPLLNNNNNNHNNNNRYLGPRLGLYPIDSMQSIQSEAL